MRYKNPATVKSPKGKIKDVDVIYDGGGPKEGDTGFSIALVTWGGKRVLAMRWNISANEWHDPQKIDGTKECIGNPQSRGNSTWFIIPTEIFNPASTITTEIISKLVALNIFKL